MGVELIFTCDRCARAENGLQVGMEGSDMRPEGWAHRIDPRVHRARKLGQQEVDQVVWVDLCVACEETMIFAVDSAADAYTTAIKIAFEDPEWVPVRVENDAAMREKERQRLADGGA